MTFKATVQDSQGNDLLDPASNDWFIGTEMSFRGNVDVLDQEDTCPSTKAVMPEYEGVGLKGER